MFKNIVRRHPLIYNNIYTRNINVGNCILERHKQHQYTTNGLSKSQFEELYQVRSNIELLIQDYAKKTIPPITYKQLLQHKPKLSANDKYIYSIETINYLLTLTCKRLAAFQSLPYIAVINPNIEQSYRLYLKTLESLLSIEFPYGLHDQEFMECKFQEFLNDHQDTLYILSCGFQEIMDWYPKEKVFEFLDCHLHDRISMKLLATHYLKLTTQTNDCDEYIGIVHKNMNISNMIKRAGEFVGDLTSVKYDRNVPLEILTGQDIIFPCIPTELEYVFQEILKNSMRAHIENNNTNLIEKPIEVIIIRNNSEIEIRFRDFGGGIPPNVEDKMFEYSYTTTENSNNNGIEGNIMPGENIATVSGMGFGLPLCKAYLNIFQGNLEVESLWGWGTDVYIKLKGPDESLLK